MLPSMIYFCIKWQLHTSVCIIDGCNFVEIFMQYNKLCLWYILEVSSLALYARNWNKLKNFVGVAFILKIYFIYYIFVDSITEIPGITCRRVIEIKNSWIKKWSVSNKCSQLRLPYDSFSAWRAVQWLVYIFVEKLNHTNIQITAPKYTRELTKSHMPRFLGTFQHSHKADSR